MTLVLVITGVLQDTTSALPLCSYAQKETYSLPVIGIPTPRVSTILDKQGLKREGVKTIAVYSDSPTEGLVLSFTANFDTLGRVTEEMFYKSSTDVPNTAEFLGNPYIRYTYLGQSSKIDTQVAVGNVLGKEIQFQTIYQYNLDGCLQRQEHYNKKEGEAARFSGYYLYNYKDNYYTEETNFRGEIYNYTFNDDGVLESYERYVPNNIIFIGDNIVQYGNIRVENGQVIEDVTNYVTNKSNPYPSGFFSIRYGIQGQVVQRSQFNINQDLVSKNDYQYNVQGNLINHTRTSYRSGEITIIRVTNCEYIYDTRGNWTRRVCQTDKNTNTNTTVRDFAYY